MIFVMAGGGTGGHVIPAIAVAKEIVRLGHSVEFVGTERGVESRLVPAAGFALKRIRVGGMKNLGMLTKLTSLSRLAVETSGQWHDFGTLRPAGVFSMGGYVAGPPVLAALARGVPVVVMEPNAFPGATNKWISKWVSRALINFEETRRYFPAGRTELTGLPVRQEFFSVPAKAPSLEFTILITGGSQGSRTLNEAARASWPLVRKSGLIFRFIHQTGAPMQSELAKEFAASDMKGDVVAFIGDMPAAFSQADLIVCRSGAGAVSELAAAGKPSILIPFPFRGRRSSDQTRRSSGARGGCDSLERQGMDRREVFRNSRRLESRSESPPNHGRSGAQAREAGRSEPGCRNTVARSNEKRAKALTAWVSDRNNSYSKCFFHGSICISRESAGSA